MVYRRETGRAWLMSFSVLATTTTLWSTKWDSGIAWSVVGRRAVCYSLAVPSREEIILCWHPALRDIAHIGTKFAKIRFSLKWPCVCEISEFVELTHPFLWSRSFLIQSQFRKFRNVSEGNFGGAREDLERQRLGPTLTWLKIWRKVLFLVGQL